MDLRKVRKLIEIFHESELVEIEIREGEDAIRLTRQSSAASAPIQTSGAETRTPIAPDTTAPETAEDFEAEGLHAVRSPMVGTFYRAASPNDAPFVQVGDSVEAGHTLCLIEAMKIFNQIEASASGTVTKVLKESGEPVEFGELLFLIKE